MVKKVSLKEQIREGIFKEIIKGELTGILNEKELIERYEVSKTSVREALIELCQQDVLRVIPRCGYEVVTVSDRDVRDATELRMLLELSCFERAVANMTPEDIARFKDWAFQLKHTLSMEIWQYWDRNLSFHVQFNAFAGNRLMNETLSKTLNILWRANAQQWKRKQATQMQLEGQHPHQVMMLLLEEGKVAEAKKVLEDDIRKIPKVMSEF
ncbi:MAG: GntR family transcriptional regulator [Enterocloster asparagiformis]|nr:GntR family transcriptional regulator [Enterocloster asparagiformis]